MIWLLQSSFQAVVLICLIFVFKFFVGKKLSIKWHWALWILLLARMIFPWGLSDKPGVFNAVPNQAKQTIFAFVLRDLSLFDLSIPKEQQALKSIEIGTPNTKVLKANPMSFSNGAATDAVQRRFLTNMSIRDLLFGIWLLGVAAMTGVALRANMKLWQALKREKEIDCAATISLFEKCARDLGVKTAVSIMETDLVTTPGLFGFLKPRLLLPAGFTEAIPREALRHVFLHELAHIKRRDVFIGWVANVLQILHWFNPLVWFAFRRMQSDRELATDGLALSIMNQDEPMQYGRTIIEMIELFSGHGRLSSMTGVLEHKSQAKRRIEMISDFKQKSYKWSPMAIIILIAIGCMSLPEADLNTSEEGTSAKRTEAIIPNAAATQNTRPADVQEHKACIPQDVGERLLSCEFLHEKQGFQSTGSTRECELNYIASAWNKATKLHVEAVGSEKKPGTADKNTMSQALKIYEELAGCSNLVLPAKGVDDKTRPTLYSIAYYEAELLWTMEDWSKCGPAFDEVTNIDLKGIYTNDAAYGALFCYSKMYGSQGGESDGKSDSSSQGELPLKPKNLDDGKKGILTAYDRYVCLVPSGEDTENVKYRRAKIYYEANMFTESAVLFKELVLKHPQSKSAVSAANLYLDSLNNLAAGDNHPNKSCFDDMAKAIDMFSNTGETPGKYLMQDKDFAAQLEKLKADLKNKRG